MIMLALRANGVCKKYGEQDVLKDFSLTLEEGAFEAVMGPSGSGKSTFLHIASGLVGADSGSVEVGGRDVVKMRDRECAIFRRRNIGVIFQAFNLLNEKTVRENIILPLKLDKAKVDEARFEELTKLLGIEKLLDKKPEALSGGEQQRVAIARALIANPPVVFADEPTGNLDMNATKGICAQLKNLNEKVKSAILVVTHDPVVAATAKRVHFLKDGVIVATCETGGDPALVSKLYLETYA